MFTAVFWWSVSTEIVFDTVLFARGTNLLQI